jgi:hypothetical protein
MVIPFFPEARLGASGAFEPDPAAVVNPAVAGGLTGGAFHFLSTEDRKPKKMPLFLNIPTALTGQNPRNVADCSKTEMHPLTGEILGRKLLAVSQRAKQAIPNRNPLRLVEGWLSVV